MGEKGRWGFFKIIHLKLCIENGVQGVKCLGTKYIARTAYEFGTDHTIPTKEVSSRVYRSAGLYCYGAQRLTLRHDYFLNCFPYLIHHRLVELLFLCASDYRSKALSGSASVSAIFSPVRVKTVPEVEAFDLFCFSRIFLV